MKYFAGIGARTTPKEICDVMTLIAKKLESMSYTLRSGGSVGADWAFQKSVSNAQIWLPWKNFNMQYQLQKPEHDYRLVLDDPEAKESLKFHPKFPNLKDSVEKMMERNYRQIRGLNEPDSKFVFCWTERGEEIGGTGQAIRIANHYNIPIYNLGKPDILERVYRFLEK